jgi:outer membrane receptor for ferrienterochelin and colicins
MLFEAPAVVVVVPRSEFEVYGDRTLFQLLQRQPSIYTRSSFVYADSMAGFRGDMSAHSETHTLLLLNGRPIRESAQAIDSPIYMTFPVDFLDGVELIRGPGSVLYGTNAFSGIINLKTRPVPEQPELSFSSMAGSYGYYDTTITGGARFGEVGFIGSIRVGGQEGWRYRMTDALGVYGEDDVREQNVSAAAHLECHRFTLDVFGSNMDAFALGVQPFWSDADQELRNKRLFVNAGYEVPLHERARLDLNLTYNLQENDMFSPFTPRIGTNTSDVLGEVTLFANPTDALNLVVGYLQEYRSNYAPDEDHFQSIPPYDYSPKSAYAQGDYAIGDKAKLIAGTQWNESPQGRTDLISRYGVIVTPTERWGVKLLRGEAFRAPIALESRLDDPPILVGNENLMPETVTTYDAQLFYHDERTYAAVTYFHSAFDRQILFDTNTSDPMTYMNGGEQTFEGIEFEFKRFLTTNWHHHRIPRDGQPTTRSREPAVRQRAARRFRAPRATQGPIVRHVPGREYPRRGGVRPDIGLHRLAQLLPLRLRESVLCGTGDQLLSAGSHLEPDARMAWPRTSRRGAWRHAAPHPSSAHAVAGAPRNSPPTRKLVDFTRHFRYNAV